MEEEIFEDLLKLKESMLLNQEETMRLIYPQFRSPFNQFIKGYLKDSQKSNDLYQETMIALYQNIINGKINTNKASVKTYIFEIGKRLAMNENLKTSKTTYVDQFEDRVNAEGKDNIVDHSITLAINKLGETCRKILTLYYVKRFSIEAIMHRLNMKSTNTVKASKSRCLRQLRESINYRK